MGCLSHETWKPMQVDTWQGDTDQEENLGSKEKFWRVDPAGNQWLFKRARIDTRDGTVSGEDWAECLVHELSTLIGIPTAHANLAEYGGKRGVVSKQLLTVGQTLIHGNELLAVVDPEYPADVRQNNLHLTVSAVKASLSGIGAPGQGEIPPEFDAFATLTGYLMVDAWVAGQDRHHENWAVIADGSVQRLAPSYDHGNAFGCQLRDGKRESLLANSKALPRWVGRGKNPYFAGEPRLVDLIHEAFMLAGANVQRHWIDRLHSVRRTDVENAVAQVPERLMSDVGRSFVTELLMTNRERIVRYEP